jgi:sugar phosphate isomerase/epimerase
MKPRLAPAAITDEFSPDLEIAARAMQGAGLDSAELRVLWGANILDLGDAELDRTANLLNAAGLKVVSIASPLFKCVLPGGEALDSRFERDVFGAPHTFEDQPRLLQRAFHAAHRFGAPVIRIFSFWRTVDRSSCFDRIAAALYDAVRQAAHEDVVLGIENEHACNAGTAGETAALLRAVNHPNLKVVWDPANAYVAGETPFPDGYRKLAASDIVHVHAKDCRLIEGRPDWLPLGTGAVDWKGHLAALAADGYRGAVSLETHWSGPNGDKLLASTICAWNLRGLLSW